MLLSRRAIQFIFCVVAAQKVKQRLFDDDDNSKHSIFLLTVTLRFQQILCRNDAFLVYQKGWIV